ncbi:hypothetical protein CG478_013175 [Bacillus cytotoxicus]|nr:hypothetical protein CG483_013175 [Bacillus cytotoxicus]AWC33174.1 hypothetical protein CG482_012780 [Bacillus cytotoxicus]AWC37199.1 hypothetical protein CG481_012795 [Bacillus cytotoxicus]AWC41313.1 hypothetical protein CG480_013175 [Bacillus cytotoxicus]AWC45182.1 hypothetical protein CG479_012265 [Bacillus cytotoxicus]
MAKRTERYLNFIESDPILSKILGRFSSLVLLYIIIGGCLVTTIENEYVRMIFSGFYFISIIIFNIFFIIRFVKYRKKSL